MHLPSSVLSTLVTFVVSIGPIEAAVIFTSLTTGIHHKERRSRARRSVTIAGLMLVLFAVGGNLVLSCCMSRCPHFAWPAACFLQALTLTFASPGLSTINEREGRVRKSLATLRFSR